jgi:hypothetical protein
MAAVAPKIALPYLGETSLDVIVFVSTAIYYRIYQWRRDTVARRSTFGHEESHFISDEKLTLSAADHQDPHPHAIYRANTTEGFKDKGLYDFIDKCVESKQKLRKVEDPEAARRQKLRRLRAESMSKSDNHIQLSPHKLRAERQRLRPVNL